MKTTVKDGVIHLDSGKLEIYTPQVYVGSIASINGDTAATLGAAVYKYYTDPKDKKPSKVGVLNIPSIITFYPTYLESNVKDTIWDGIYDDLNENEYTVLSFEAGSKIMNQYSIKHLNNVVSFFDLLIERKIDNNIPYNMLSKIFMKNCTMNGVDLGCPISIIDLIIYKLCRSKKDINKPFAHVIGKDPKVSQVAYQFVNIRDICSTDSVFAALAFEDMNSMLDSSLNMTLREQEQNVSPIEQIIKM